VTKLHSIGLLSAFAMLVPQLSYAEGIADCVYPGRRPDGSEPSATYLFNRCDFRLNAEVIDQGDCRRGCNFPLPEKNRWNSVARVTGQFRFYVCKAPQQVTGLTSGRPHCF